MTSESKEDFPSKEKVEENGHEIDNIQENFTETSSTSTEGPANDQGDAIGFNENPSSTNFSPGLPYRRPNQINTFTSRDSPFYDLSRGTKLALVFNHSDYQYERMPTRNGTENDVQAITQTFAEMDFEIKVEDNLTVQQIQMKLMEIQRLPDLSCLALFILTHGEENGVLMAYDSNYTLNKTIIPELLPDHCPSLAGKPKMIFIQACQGEETDSGVKLVGPPVPRTEHDGARIVPYCIPNHSDLLIYSAAFSGHFSFRTPTTGSWLIQALCKELKKSEPEDDLVSILTRVSFYVAVHKTSNVPGNRYLDQKKQIPLKQDTLIRKIYLKQGEIQTVTNGNHENTSRTRELATNISVDQHKGSKNRERCTCM